MTHERDIERLLDHWFSDGPNEAPDRVLDAVSDRIGRQSQRPTWRLNWRHLDMNTTFKLATGIAAVAIVAILGYNLLPRASSGVGAAPSIDGTWVTSFTKADLIASPLRVDDNEINDGNWGDFTLTFEDGRFSLALSNSVQSATSSGTYTTDGDTIALVLQTSPTVRETFGFRWSIANDVLTFQRDETVGAGPTGFLVKPWTRSP